MDLDATLTKHGKRLGEIETFVQQMKGLMAGADTNVVKATDDLDALLAFKTEVEQTIPMIRKAIMDAQNVVAEFNSIVAAFQPTFAWVQSQMAAEETRKANRAAAVAAGELVEHTGDEAPPANAVDQPGAQTA